jgi:4,5-dihydroxyphthalate decarboxylase
MTEATVLRAAIGDHPQTLPLKAGEVGSDLLRFDFADIAPINRAFAPMVRELRFDVCEMAIATFLQAKSHGRELVLLPIALTARFQERALLCRADSDLRGPAGLAGRRVGVRSYSQTTAMWLRGTLAEMHGVRPEQMRWVTLEDGHVDEYSDPPWAERAPHGKDLLGMLRAGELDAVIVGSDVPDDADLRPVFANPAIAGEAFRHRHCFVPVNHMLVARRALATRRPDLVRELLRMFRAAKVAAMPEDADVLPMDLPSLRPAIDVALRYAAEQGLLGRRLSPVEVWEGLPDK